MNSIRTVSIVSCSVCFLSGLLLVSETNSFSTSSKNRVLEKSKMSPRYFDLRSSRTDFVCRIEEIEQDKFDLNRKFPFGKQPIPKFKDFSILDAEMVFGSRPNNNSNHRRYFLYIDDGHMQNKDNSVLVEMKFKHEKVDSYRFWSKKFDTGWRKP